MRTLIQLAATTALALAGSAAHASDFAPLMDTIHSTWPEKTHLAVVADYSRSRDEIRDLAKAAGEGSTITVMDIRGASFVEKAGTYLMLRVKPDYLVMLPHDPQVWDGSFSATRLIGMMAYKGIPTVGTSSKAIAQGAVLAMGAGTGFDLLVTHKMIGTVEVILPQKGRYVNARAGLGPGMASIEVVGR